MGYLDNIPEDWQVAFVKADHGDKDAQDFVKFIQMQGLSDCEIRKIKQEIYLPLACRGDVDCMFYMARACIEEPEKSYKWFYKCAMAGHTESMNRIGMGYTKNVNDNYPQTGYGYDNELAKYWLLKSYEHGDYEGLRLYAIYCCEDSSEEQKDALLKASKQNWEALVDYIDVFYYSPESKDGRYDKWLLENYLRAIELFADISLKERLGYVFYNIGCILGKKYYNLPVTKINLQENSNDAATAVMYFSFANYLGVNCTAKINCIVESTGILFDNGIYKTYCAIISEKYGV